MFGLGQSLVQPGPNLVWRVGAPLPLIARDQHTTGDDAGNTGESDPLPHVAHG